MSFKTLSDLLATQAALTEGNDAEIDIGGGIGPNPHPVLSRAELVRFSDKMNQAYTKLEEVRSIFKHAPDATGPAHKLHHIGTKGGMDMVAFDDVVKKLDDLEEAINELHQTWGSHVQSETGAFDDESTPVEDAPEDSAASVDDEDALSTPAK